MAPKRWYNLAALLIGCLLSFGLLEIALRIYNPMLMAVNPDVFEVRRNVDFVSYNENIPGVAPQTHVHQNTLGFRGPDPPADFDRYLTIVTVGGSTTHDVRQEDDRTWTALLGAMVADCFTTTWINNAGFEAQGSLGHINLIRQNISKLHPKVVILLIGANELRVDGLVRGPNDLSSDSPAKNFVKALAEYSAVIDLGVTLYRSYRLWRGTGRQNPVVGQAMPAQGDQRLVMARQLQPGYADRLHRIINLLRDNNILPVFLTQPTIGGGGIDPSSGTDLSLLWYGDFFEKSFDIYNDTMRQVAAAEHVPLIDLARLLPKDTKYYWDPEHHTDAGVAKIAELLAPRLLPVLKQNFRTFDNGRCDHHAGG